MFEFFGKIISMFLVVLFLGYAVFAKKQLVDFISTIFEKDSPKESDGWVDENAMLWIAIPWCISIFIMFITLFFSSLITSVVILAYFGWTGYNVFLLKKLSAWEFDPVRKIIQTYLFASAGYFILLGYFL